MSATTSIRHVLDALNDGRIVRRTVATALRILAVVTAAAGGLGALMTLAVIFRVGSAAGADLQIFAAGVIYAVLVAAIGWCLNQVARYRARSVEALAPSTFSVIPIVSVLLRLIGEVLAVVCLGFGIGTFILFLFGAGQVARDGAFGGMSGYFSPSGGLVGAALSLGVSVLSALISMLIAYGLAESVAVLADIAINIGILAQRGAPLPVVTPGRPAPHAYGLPACVKCAGVLEPEAAFCGNCGTPVESQGVA